MALFNKRRHFFFFFFLFSFWGGFFLSTNCNTIYSNRKHMGGFFLPPPVSNHETFFRGKDNFFTHTVECDQNGRTLLAGLKDGPLSPARRTRGSAWPPQVPRHPGTQVHGTLCTRKKVVKEQPQLHMTNTKVSSHVGHSCTEEIMIQQFTRKIT